MRFRANAVVMAGLLFGNLNSVSLAQPLAPEALDNARQGYSDAVQAIDRGQWTEYLELRPALDEYPLAIYLDYYQLTRGPRAVRPADARRFLDASQDSPLPNRFLAHYLTQAGRDRRWKDFLAVKPDEPNSVELKCYYFRALLATGDPLAAWEGAERLWVHGESRPKQCDPLFEAWMRAGQVSDEVVWARMLKAFESRRGSLMKYVARKGSDELRPWTDKLLSVYARPASMRRVALPADSLYSADIASYGLAYLARYNPEQALANWMRYREELRFDAEQVRRVEHAIALQGLFARTEANLGWLPGALERLGEDRLVEIRLRWALAERDWAAVAATLELLSPEARAGNGWRYWQARTLEVRGDRAAAEPIYAALAKQRDFYGFLAADRMRLPYSFNHQSLLLQSAATEPVRRLPAVQRVGELYHHDEQRLAHSEWHKVLEDYPATEQRQALAQLATAEGWYSMAINAAARAEAWDALDWRFPTPYRDIFGHYAEVQRVPSTELMAIARRESAFFPEARSPVGARGLMQVMPATGQQVAAQLGRPHTREELYQVEHNVLLGSAYYRQLLDRFDNNRIYALAAYNAGPHRVERWRNPPEKGMTADLWVETIPFRETRDYVKNVMAYNVVFQYLLGDTPSLLTPTERDARY